jgi:hypothetical protein
MKKAEADERGAKKDMTFKRHPQTERREDMNMPLRAPNRHIPLRKLPKAATPADSYLTCTVVSNPTLHLIISGPLWLMQLQLPLVNKTCAWHIDV